MSYSRVHVKCGECSSAPDCSASMTNAEAVRCDYYAPMVMDEHLNNILTYQTECVQARVNQAFNDRNKFMATQPPYYSIRREMQHETKC